MSEVRMIADKKHEAFNCSGKAHSIIDAGAAFTCDEGRAVRLVERGIAHYDLSEPSAVGEADEQPETFVPAEVELVKVDGRTKAGRAAKGR